MPDEPDPELEARFQRYTALIEELAKRTELIDIASPEGRARARALSNAVIPEEDREGLSRFLLQKRDHLVENFEFDLEMVNRACEDKPALSEDERLDQ